MIFISRLINNSLQQLFCKYLLSNTHNNTANINIFSNKIGLKKNLQSVKLDGKAQLHNDIVISDSLLKTIRFAYSTQTSTTTNEATRIILNKQMIVSSHQQQQPSVTQVKPQSQELLFIDSDTLQNHIKMEKLRHEIRTNKNTKIESNNIGSTSKHNQSQSNYNSLSLQNQYKNLPINRFQYLNIKTIAFTEHNQHLSKGQFQQYKDYPLVKLTEICLRLIKQYHDKKEKHIPTQGQNRQKCLYQNRTIQQHWRELQYYIRKRMHNCPLKQYMRIFYITQHTYKQIYKFNHNFIDSLIKGLKPQIPLMQETQLMELYLILSQNQLPQRYHYELGLRYSIKYQTDEIIKSPFYQHEMLYKLQQEIAEKIVKKYQKKYIKTQLTLKSDDLIKIIWWLKSFLLWNNTKFSLIKGNQMGNEKKNQYIVGLMNVLLSKYDKDNKDNVSNSVSQGIKRLTHVSGGSLKIQNKSVAFNSIDELLQLLSTLSLIRQHLQIQSQTHRSSKQYASLTNSEIILDKNEIWLEKSQAVNRIVNTIITYGNVQQMIEHCLLVGEEVVVNCDQHFNDSKQENQDQLTQINNIIVDSSNKIKTLDSHTVRNKLQLLKSLSQFKQSTNNPHTIHSWCFSLINHYNIFLLLQQSTNLFNNTTHDCQQQQLTTSSLQQRLDITECQLYILYMIYNNVYYVNKLQKSKSGMLDGKENGGYGVDRLWQCYKDILKNRFNANQNLLLKTAYITLLPPQFILKMIYLQLSYNQITKSQHQQKEKQSQSNQHQKEYPAAELIQAYAKNMLENNNYANHVISLYVRELELPLYTYIGAVFKCKQHNMLTELQIDMLNTLHTITSRNSKAKHYLLSQNIHYQSITNPYHNPFIHTTPSHLLLQNNNSLSLTNNKNKHIDYNDKQSILLGQYIMKCLEKEKKEWLRKEEIVKLTKFFTEIKAFNELRFCHPITDFTVTAQFLFSIIQNSNNKSNIINNIPSKILIFLSPQQLIKPDIMAQKVIYQTQGLEMIVIDRKQFLSMHINQRIQKLNQLLFAKNEFSLIRYLMAK